MLRDATKFAELMKAKIDSIVADDAKIQEFLTWLHDKFGADETIWPEEARQKFADRLGFSFSSRKADKAFILSLSLNLYLSVDLSLYLDLDLYLCLYFSLSVDLNLCLYPLDLLLNLTSRFIPRPLPLIFNLCLDLNLDRVLARCTFPCRNEKIQNSIQILKQLHGITCPI